MQYCMLKSTRTFNCLITFVNRSVIITKKTTSKVHYDL